MKKGAIIISIFVLVFSLGVFSMPKTSEAGWGDVRLYVGIGYNNGYGGGYPYYGGGGWGGYGYGYPYQNGWSNPYYGGYRGGWNQGCMPTMGGYYYYGC